MKMWQNIAAVAAVTAGIGALASSSVTYSDWQPADPMDEVGRDANCTLSPPLCPVVWRWTPTGDTITCAPSGQGYRAPDYPAFDVYFCCDSAENAKWRYVYSNLELVDIQAACGDHIFYY